MLLSEFQRTIETLFPTRFAMPGDTIGLQIESGSTTQNVLICFEITSAVIDEAIRLQCDTIVAFHPLIYTPLTKITSEDRVGSLSTRLLQQGISLLCVHTAFDAHPQGTNAILAHKLGLEVSGPLVHADSSHNGMGLIARTKSPMPVDEFVETVKLICGGPVKYVSPVSGFVERVAIVSGSGMSYFDAAVNSGADTFLTADVKYQGFLAAKDVIGLIDPGHFEMEQFVAAGIGTVLSAHLNDSIQIHTSRVSTNPIHYSYPQHNVYSSQPSGTV